MFHGTAPQTSALIAEDGLLPMARQFVHLSRDRETAMSVGRRRAGARCSSRFNTVDAVSGGVTFYEGNDLVWLAESAPARVISVVG